MPTRINCKANDGGCWCRDTRVKRSLFGLGARMCLVSEGKPCPYLNPYPRPTPPTRTPGGSQEIGFNK